MTRRGIGAAGAALLAAVAVVGPAGGDEPRAAVVTDAVGKEVTLAAARFTAGTRRLGWLGTPKDAPLALEVREPHSTTYQKGVVTLIPVAAVAAVRYDYEKLTLAVSVKGLAAPVAGTLQFKGINTCGVEGAAGGLVGKFAGGTKDGFRSVVFPTAAALPPRPPGAAWAVQIDQPKAMHPTLAVRNLKALYAAPGGVEFLADDLPTRKGPPLKLDPKALRRLEVLAVDPNTQTAAAELTPADGPERLVAFPLTRDHAGKAAQLVGLLGEVDAGWKLFPLHAVKAVGPAP